MRWQTVLFTSLLVVTMSGQLAAQTNVPATAASGEGLHRIFIPFALHYPVHAADGSVAKALDGFGQAVDGNQQPMFDTLIGIANPSQQAVNIRFIFFNESGVPQLWGDKRPYRDYLLRPKASLATTLIPYNVFPDPPQSFTGYAILELTNASGTGEVPKLPVYAMLGGGGFYPDHWNTFSANIPVYTSAVPKARQWFFPYLIPYFEDANHYGDLSYRTGMSITNFGEEPVRLKLTYHVGDVYPRAGNVVSFEKTISGRQFMTFDIYQELRKAGYPQTMNSEGWLLVESDAPSAIVPYMLHANRSFSRFSVGQAATISEGR